MISISINAVTSGAFFTASAPLPPDDFMWTSYTATFADLSAAATLNTITLAAFPAKTVLHAVAIKHDTAFAGGTIAGYTVSVGPAATLDKYASAFNVFQPVGTATGQLSHALFCENFVVATQLYLTATSTVGLLNAATAGSVTISLLTTTLP